MHVAWAPEIRDGLARLLDGPPSTATFDFDNTCIIGDSTEAILRTLRGQEGIDEYRRREAEDQTDAYAWLVAEVGAGRSEDENRSLALEVFRAQTASGAVRPREEVVALYAALVERGWQVWVISGAFQIAVQTYAEQIGIDGPVLGARLQQDADGRSTRTLQPPLPHREGKVTWVRRVLGDVQPGLALGDADADIEMLSHARHALVIDRGHLELSARARSGGWWLHPYARP